MHVAAKSAVCADCSVAHRCTLCWYAFMLHVDAFCAACRGASSYARSRVAALQAGGCIRCTPVRCVRCCCEHAAAVGCAALRWSVHALKLRGDALLVGVRLRCSSDHAAKCIRCQRWLRVMRWWRLLPSCCSVAFTCSRCARLTALNRLVREFAAQCCAAYAVLRCAGGSLRCAVAAACAIDCAAPATWLRCALTWCQRMHGCSS
ncbi:hypothetical protein KOW79_013517 [Hemibagrus wyckioides]|uniref:Uncharacterized protein n=1 Tax=Hemibagrus wyckioides TaxID=337641 RepID=A0A9D3NKK9_9TELE|nr:hypothetical protein KOW79_013517 [Hemibagrus wyckioides]